MSNALWKVTNQVGDNQAVGNLLCQFIVPYTLMSKVGAEIDFMCLTMIVPACGNFVSAALSHLCCQVY